MSESVLPSKQKPDATMIYRYVLPVDDQPHSLILPGPILSWGCRRRNEVELWTWAGRPGDTEAVRDFWVVGTGQFIPDGPHFEHRATVVSPDQRLVWHILEMMI